MRARSPSSPHFLDSSSPLPGVVDGSVLFLSAQQAGRWLYYAAMATAGSMLGCYVLYIAGAERRARLPAETVQEETRRAPASRRSVATVCSPSSCRPSCRHPRPSSCSCCSPASPRFPRSHFFWRCSSAGAFDTSTLAYLAHRYGPDASRFVSAQPGAGLDLARGGRRRRRPRVGAVAASPTRRRMNRRTVQPDLSIVIPVYNEAPNLEPLYREFTEALDAVRPAVRNDPGG